MSGIFRIVVGLMSALFVAATSAHALPFNDDMVNVQKRTGSVMRSKPAGSVPIGSLDDRVESFADAQALVNPLKGDEISKENGRRLFHINCSPCHGDISKKDWTPGPVGQKWMQTLPGTFIPDLRGMDNNRKKDYAAVTDGYIYGVMHFGFGLMSGYGWKLSPVEHWDIVNYIRSEQGKN